MELEQTALPEANNAENAANKADNEIVDSEGDASEIDEIIDYSTVAEEDLDAAIKETETQMKVLERKALREMLIRNGHALREILRTEKVKAHYAYGTKHLK